MVTDVGVAAAHAGILVIPQAPHLSASEAAVAIENLQAVVSVANELYAFDRASRVWLREPGL